MIRFRRMLLLACSLTGLLTGCREKPALTAAVSESNERESPLFKKARAAELSGNMKEAARVYRELLVEEPRSFSAHFQLATILQDSAEDYIGAIYHYNEYLQFRPQSDKSKLASERIRIAEQLLAPQILRRVGDSVEGISQAHLLKENDRLNRIITTLEGDKSKLAEERDKAQKDLAATMRDYEHLREILEKMKSATAAAPTARKDLGKIRSTEAQSSATPSASKDLGKIREAATKSAADSGRAINGLDITALRREAESLAASSAKASELPAAAEAPTAAQGTSAADAAVKKPNHRATDTAANAKRTYVVQPGDTLFRVSEKFYGDSTHWKKIRNANRTVIDPDGRIRAGQVIAVP